jgi:hypothetical protein
MGTMSPASCGMGGLRDHRQAAALRASKRLLITYNLLLP